MTLDNDTKANLDTLADDFEDFCDGKTICARCVHKCDTSNDPTGQTWRCHKMEKPPMPDYVSGNYKTGLKWCSVVNTDGECPDFEEVQGDGN